MSDEHERAALPLRMDGGTIRDATGRALTDEEVRALTNEQMGALFLPEDAAGKVAAEVMASGARPLTGAEVERLFTDLGAPAGEAPEVVGAEFAEVDEIPVDGLHAGVEVGNDARLDDPRHHQVTWTEYADGSFSVRNRVPGGTAFTRATNSRQESWRMAIEAVDPDSATTPAENAAGIKEMIDPEVWAELFSEAGTMGPSVFGELHEARATRADLPELRKQAMELAVSSVRGMEHEHVLDAARAFLVFMTADPLSATDRKALERAREELADHRQQSRFLSDQLREVIRHNGGNANCFDDELYAVVGSMMAQATRALGELNQRALAAEQRAHAADGLLIAARTLDAANGPMTLTRPQGEAATACDDGDRAEPYYNQSHVAGDARQEAQEARNAEARGRVDGLMERDLREVLNRSAERAAALGRDTGMRAGLVGAEFERQRERYRHARIHKPGGDFTN